MLCPRRARSLFIEVTLGTDLSDPSASLVGLPVIHELSLSKYRCDGDSYPHAPRPAQIRVCTQSDQIPDNLLPMRQQADVGPCLRVQGRPPSTNHEQEA